MLEVMGRIVHSATYTPQPLPDEAKSEALLNSLVGRLRADYAKDDFLLLQTKPTDAADREKVCLMTGSLYKRVLELPPDQSSALLRFLLAQK